MLKALIIEDESDICYLLGNILKQKHLYTEFVNTLYEAERALARATPEIIFLDNHLPDGLGTTFIAYIKKKYPTAKVIMISAHDSQKNTAMYEGADYFITKPFSRDAIYDTVDKLVSDDTAEQQLSKI